MTQVVGAIHASTVLVASIFHVAVGDIIHGLIQSIPSTTNPVVANGHFFGHSFQARKKTLSMKLSLTKLRQEKLMT